MELIKTAVKVGNSAGVLLPKKWLNTQVKVVLEPLNIKKDVLELLVGEGILKNVLGIYIFGSYAREEQTIDSDVDILVITNNINKRIKKGKYEIIFVTKQELETQLEKNTFPILPMLKESKTIINEELIKSYLNTSLTKKNLKYYIETTKSAMKVIEKSIKLSKEMKINESDASAYSLILRLRTLYIIECIRKNKEYKKNDFLKLIKKTAGSLVSYEEYIRVKSGDKKMKYELPIAEAEKLMNYINKKIVEVEKWLLQK